jgi:hypothetical protein
MMLGLLRVFALDGRIMDRVRSNEAALAIARRKIACMPYHDGPNDDNRLDN